jgi:hypothetical protein
VRSEHSAWRTIDFQPEALRRLGVTAHKINADNGRFSFNPLALSVTLRVT